MGRRALAGLLLVGLAGAARADVPVESVGRVETLPLPPGPHWAWVGDPVFRHATLVDLSDGRTLGIVNAGFGMPTVLTPAARPEFYVVETHYSRGSRGERTDVLTIYGGRSLAAEAEVVLPPKRAHAANTAGMLALSDDDRFVAIFNLTPATSLSIVDVEARRFSAEIETPGCSLAYAAGPRRFASLCMDGALMLVEVDDEGREARKTRSDPFFDPQLDPVTEKAARWGDRWLFASFGGWIHPVDLSGAAPRFEERWSLVSDAERADDWRIGGMQHLAVHGPTGRLYALMHRGGPHSHKQGGTEIWIYDLASHERLQRIELRGPGFSYLGVPIRAEGFTGWLIDKLADWTLGMAPDIAVDAIAVTQDAAPRLVTVGAVSGAVASYDALTGEFLGRAYVGNATNVTLSTPFARTGGWR
jgi:methylamine dehydrogenase heavy chain